MAKLSLRHYAVRLRLEPQPMRLSLPHAIFFIATLRTLPPTHRRHCTLHSKANLATEAGLVLQIPRVCASCGGLFARLRPGGGPTFRQGLPILRLQRGPSSPRGAVVIFGSIPSSGFRSYRQSRPNGAQIIRSAMYCDGGAVARLSAASRLESQSG
jgi:hypothetical protein